MSVFVCVKLETRALFGAVLFTLTLLGVLLSLGATLANGFSLLPVHVVLVGVGMTGSVVDGGVVGTVGTVVAVGCCTGGWVGNGYWRPLAAGIPVPGRKEVNGRDEDWPDEEASKATL